MKKINWKKRTMHRILAGALTLILLTAGMSSSICAAEAGPVSEAQEQAAQEYMTEDLYTLQAGDEDASISEAEDIENTISEDQDMEADPAEDYVSASTSEGAVDDTNTEVEETVETEAPPETCFEETGENHEEADTEANDPAAEEGFIDEPADDPEDVVSDSSFDTDGQDADPLISEKEEDSELISADEEITDLSPAEAAEENEVLTDEETEDQTEQQPVNDQGSVAPPVGTIVKGYAKGQSYIPAEHGADVADNDSIFAAYVNREMDLKGALRSDTGDYTVREPRLSNYAGSKLSGYNKTVYGALLEFIRAIAEGYRSSTEIWISPEEIGADKLEWSAADLGMDTIVSETDTGNYITQEALDAVSESLGIDMGMLCDALLYDCPYDLYWYDKVTGCFYSDLPVSGYWNGSEWLLYLDGDICFTFYVAPEYSESGEKKTTYVESSVGTAVRTAKENAQTIVNEFESYSDYDKLDIYRYMIRELTDYNYDAAEDEAVSYGNPWQLIWVFDGDPDTKVVCEGYSKAFQYLCDMTTFYDGTVRDCYSVTGWAFNGEPHMWNLVRLADGRSYLADITNCNNEDGDAEEAEKLFLVGTGTEDSDNDGLATGNARDGYVFWYADGSSEDFVYNEDTLSTYPETVLTLAEGRMDAYTEVNDPLIVNASDRHSHIYVIDPKIEPDCQYEGWTAGSHCAICGKVKTEQQSIPKTAHKFGAWKVTKKATYTAKGVKTRTCSVCGKKQTADISMLPRTSIAKGTVTGIKNKVYNGKAQKQTSVLKVNGKTLKAGTDYTISYRSNKNVGTAACVLIGKGAYKGTLTKRFLINPKPTSIKSISRHTKRLTVRWTKQSAQTTGYQIQYSSRSDFKTNKIVTISKPSTTSAAIKNLSKNRKYYLRIRTFKTVGGKKYYSTFSKVKTQRTK